MSTTQTTDDEMDELHSVKTSVEMAADEAKRVVIRHASGRVEAVFSVDELDGCEIISSSWSVPDGWEIGNVAIHDSGNVRVRVERAGD